MAHVPSLRAHPVPGWHAHGLLQLGPKKGVPQSSQSMPAQFGAHVPGLQCPVPVMPDEALPCAHEHTLLQLAPKWVESQFSQSMPAQPWSQELG